MMKLRQILEVVLYNNYLNITERQGRFNFAASWPRPRNINDYFSEDILNAEVWLLSAQDDGIYIQIVM